MKWIKASERLPDEKLQIVVKFNFKASAPQIQVLNDMDFRNILNRKIDLDRILWLDESGSEPEGKEAVELPKIVCLCGSTRFMDAFQAANLKLTCEGVIVLSVGTNTKTDAELTRENYFKDPSIKLRLDELHKRKIDLCDEVFVLNVGGYIVESTRSEIDYAKSIGKPIKYLE